jgi:hypothetical protein
LAASAGWQRELFLDIDSDASRQPGDCAARRAAANNAATCHKSNVSGVLVASTLASLKQLQKAAR